MRDQMLNHGLDQPLLGTDTGYFQVTFPGPGENLNRIRVPEARLTITPAMSERELQNRHEKLNGFLREIRLGRFPADPSSRVCPSCPAFFICGPTPRGTLRKKF